MDEPEMFSIIADKKPIKPTSVALVLAGGFVDLLIVFFTNRLHIA
jgi:hypothetical protein